LGENSPNLVTLTWTEAAGTSFCFQVQSIFDAGVETTQDMST
jgi:hypothetical protein